MPLVHDAVDLVAGAHRLERRGPLGPDPDRGGRADADPGLAGGVRPAGAAGAVPVLGLLVLSGLGLPLPLAGLRLAAAITAATAVRAVRAVRVALAAWFGGAVPAGASSGTPSGQRTAGDSDVQTLSPVVPSRRTAPPAVFASSQVPRTSYDTSVALAGSSAITTGAPPAGGRLQHRHGGHGPRRHPRRRTAAGEHPPPSLLRRDGRDRHGAARARSLARLGLVATPGHPADALVPARGRRLRCGRGAGALVRLDRHRGRPPALDRAGLHADRGSGDRGEGDLVRLRRRARCSMPGWARSRSSSCARCRGAGASGTTGRRRRPTPAAERCGREPRPTRPR